MRKYRMYGLVPYNISPIQQGIQFGHAVVEYGLKNFNEPDYQEWAIDHKTFIILNGGTTISNPNSLGSLNKILSTLEEKKIEFSTFYEPDLGDQLTAVVFLVDDRVWDRENWPDYETSDEEWSQVKRMLESFPADKDQILESFESYRIWFNKFSDSYREAELIVWLRSYLRNFKLA
jgi:hypothetical protein